MARKGSTRAWRTLRAQVLAEEPICRIATPGICTTISTTVDHILIVRDYPELEMERSNLRGACAPCNYRRGVKPIESVPEQIALRFFG